MRCFMKKIHFEFFDEEKVYYDIDLNYTKEGEYIVFTLDDVIYKVKLDDNFEFRRITLEEEFLLRDNECLVTLAGVEGHFKVRVDYYKFCKKDSEFVIEYALESDADKRKTIKFIL